jgi:hypothetical protein
MYVMLRGKVMPRYLILVLFCGVCALAFLANASPALAKDGSDGSKNFKQPNLKPYENLASVLKSSYKKNSSSGEVSKKSSKTDNTKYSKKNGSQQKSSYKSKSGKSSSTASNSKKKSSSKSKTSKKST